VARVVAELLDHEPSRVLKDAMSPSGLALSPSWRFSARITDPQPQQTQQKARQATSTHRASLLNHPFDMG